MSSWLQTDVNLAGWLPATGARGHLVRMFKASQSQPEEELVVSPRSLLMYCLNPIRNQFAAEHWNHYSQLHLAMTVPYSVRISEF